MFPKHTLTLLLLSIIVLFYRQGMAQTTSCVATVSPAGSVAYCPGASVTLTANSGSNLVYQWYLNDEAISKATARIYVATKPGSYTVRVSSKAVPAACVATFSAATVLTEAAIPTAPEFSFTPTSVECSGTFLSFAVSNPDENITYSWDFGDGTTTTGTQVKHAFFSQSLTGQDFQVTLTATNATGCSTTSPAKVVSVKPGPVISLTNNSNFRNCGGGTFKMTVFDESTLADDQTATYTIDWGDKTAVYSSTTPPAGIIHYYAVGLYTLKYSITTTSGCSVTREYNVYNISNPGVTVRATGNTIGCAPLSINFPIEGISGNDPSTTYQVDFGDGTPKKTYTHRQLLDAPILTHTYTKSSCGSPGSPPDFPKDAFFFRIVATNSCGSTPFAVGGIRVYTKSQANFTIDPTIACVGLRTKFINTTAAGFNSECNTNTNYYWNFGDGSPEVATSNLSTTPYHVYNAPGEYTVTLTAENNCSPTSISKKILVIPPPVAKFTATLAPTTGCIDATVNTQNQSTGGQTNYQWSVLPNTGYNLASGSTLSSKDPIFIFNKAGVYRIKLSAYNPCKNDTTSEKIIIKGPPTVTLPAGKTYCGPQTLAFDSSSPDHNPIYLVNNGTITNYNWVVNGAASFVNGTTANSQYPVIQFSHAGTYNVSITVINECGNSVTSSQTITINPIPDAPVLADRNICSGTSTTFSLPAGSYTYKWYNSSSSTTPIATGPSFVTGNLTANQTYYVDATSTEGCVSNRVPVNVTVTSPIQNNTIAGTQTLCNGAIPAALSGSVPSGGGNISFVWESSSDGTNYITAAGEFTEQNYTPGALPNTTWFRRKVLSETCTPSYSAPVKVEIQQSITQNTISAEQTICAGSVPAKLTGSTPLGGNNTYVYQWQSSTDNITFTDIATNGKTKDYSPTALSNTTWFRRKVTAGVCEASFSVAVQIKVTPLPVTPSAADVTICANNTAQLNATAASGIIQWFTAATGGTAIATGSDFNTPVLTQTKTYYVQATDNSCASTRKAVKVTVKPAPVVMATPGQQQICNGATTDIKLTSSITGTTFTWTQIAKDQILGATNGTGSVIAQQLINSGNTPATVTYQITPFFDGCQGTAIEVVVTVNPDLSNNSISSAQTICAGSQPTTLQGSTPNGGAQQYTYLWEISLTSATGGFGTAPGLNNKPEYTPGTLNQTAWFRRTVSSGGCSSVSPAIEITVTPVITNYNISSNQLICSGKIPAPVVGQIPNGGTNTYQYAWEVSTDGTTFNLVADSARLHFAPKAIFQTTWLRRIVSSGLCQVTSAPVRIDVQAPISQNTIGNEQVICTGTSPESLIGSLPQGGNGNYSYQWEMSTDNITFVNASGTSTGKDYSPAALTKTTWFRRKIAAGVCEASYSAAIKITVNPAISNNTITSGPQTICTGTTPATITASSPNGGDGKFVYLWEFSTSSANNGFIAASGQNNMQDYTAATLSQTTWFRRKVTSGGCTVTSTAIQVTVNQPIANNAILTGSLTLCTGNPSPTLVGSAPSAGNGTYEYIWQKSTEGPTTGFEHATGNYQQKDYNPGTLTQTTWFRRVVVSGPCEPNNSAAIKVQVNEVISNNTIAGVQTICAGSQPTALTGSTPAGGNGTYTYLWESSTTSAATGFKAALGANNGVNYTPGTLFQTTWFRRKVTSAPCDPNLSATVEVTVTPAIVNKITSTNQEICSGTAAGTIQAEIPGGGNSQYDITWESSIDNNVYAAATGNNKGTSYNPGVLQQTTWFRRKIVSGACTVWSAPVMITANPPISKNIIDGDQNLCTSSTPNEITGSVPAGGNGKYIYIWETSTDNITFVPATGINNLRDYQPGVTQQTTWFRRKVNAGTCQPNYSAAVRVSVTPGISNNSIGVAQRICVGSSVAPLVGTEAQGGNGQISYVWEVSTVSSTSGFVIATGIFNAKDYQPGNLTQTSWFRRVIISGGCSNASRAIQITVDKNIDNNTISGAQTICIQTAPKTLTGSLPSGGSQTYTYEWEYSTDGIRFLPAPGLNDQQDYTPTVLNKSTWFRRVVLSSPCGASESNTVLVTVEQLITNNIIQNNQEICSGTVPAQLTDSTPKGGSGTYTYLWEVQQVNSSTFMAAPGINNQAAYTPPALTSTTTFRRTVISGACQKLESNLITIQVKPLPPAPVVKDALTCKGSQVNLTANGLGDNFNWYTSASGGTPMFVGKTFQTPAIFQNTTYYVESKLADCTGPRVPVQVKLFDAVVNAGEDVTITKGHSTMLKATGGITYSWSPATGLSDPNIQSPLARPEQTTTYTVTAKTSDECISTDEVTVTVIPKIDVTNALTPNGDNVNDTWVIKNIEYYPEAQIDIFNRWGVKIYSSKGYRQPWDGTLNGKELPVAAYYYVIKLTAEEAPVSGSITLIR